MKNKNKLFLAVLSSILFSQFLIFAPVLAAEDYSQEFVPNVNVGTFNKCVISKATNDSGYNCLGLYIRAWYGFLLGSIGIIATVMIMVGGVEYLTSRGDKGQIDSAKQRIIAAITGIVLAFGSYTILNLINPQLLTITMPSLPFIVDNSGYNLAVTQGAPHSEGETAAAAPCPTGQSTNVGGYNFNGYAENCGHISSVEKYYQQMAGKINSAEDADKFIKMYAPNSPITGQMVMDSGADPAVVIAEMRQDSSIGTADWAVSTNNPGNVGNWGKLNSSQPTKITRNETEHYTQTSQVSGGKTTYNERHYDSPADGTNAVGRWLNQHPAK